MPDLSLSPPKEASGLTFRFLTEQDIPGFVLLYESCFGHRPSEEYIRWRYFKCDANTPCVIALDGDTYVSSYGVWSIPLLLNGMEVQSVLGIDAMTHPNYRGRGLFVLLAEACYRLLCSQGYQLLFGYPNKSSQRIGAQRLNWISVCDIPRWRRPLWLADSVVAGFIARASVPRARRSDQTTRSTEHAADPNAVAALAANDYQLFGIAPKRDAAWFTWRYHRDSGRGYQWVINEVEGKMTGVGVWRFDARARNVVLCELIGGTPAMSSVLDEVLRVALRLKARSVDFASNDPRFVSLLKSKWFIRWRGIHFHVRSFVDKPFPVDICSAKAWRITGGDMDAF